ncbi:hypothetical protein BYT27DRAFT_7204598 [Phlegmacium glaucopus]|nr:hypothetical protein BYT27DRAFT_7204598 [Phlegmacium glaucopus]
MLSPSPSFRIALPTQNFNKVSNLRPTHDDRTKRIMREFIADPHPQIDLYVNDSDMYFLKIILEVCVVTLGVNVTDATHVLEAPKDETKCPYRNGMFLLTCDIPQNYPGEPPEIRFVTFILHPNVSGMVVAMCMSLLALPKYQGLKTRKGLCRGTRPSMVVRYHPEGNFLAHLWTVVGS